MRILKLLLAINILLCVNLGVAFSQITAVDSIRNLLNNSKEYDTVKVNLLNKYAAELFKQNTDSAYFYAQKANKIAKKLGFIKGIAESYKNIAYYNLITAKYKEAYGFYSKSLENYSKINDKEKVALCYNNIGVIHKVLGDFSKAIEFNEKALVIRKEIDDKYGIASSLTNIGVLNYMLSNFDEAIDNYNQAIAFSEEANEERLVIKLLTNIGAVYEKQGKMVEALSHYQKSLKRAEKINDEGNIASNFINIGVIYFLLNDYSNATDYYKKALTIYKKLDNKEKVALLYTNIGIINENTKKYAQAEEYYNKALKIQEEIGDKTEIATVLNNLGSLYEKQNKFNEALVFFSKAVDIGAEIKLDRVIALNKSEIANIYYKQGKYNEAYNLSKEAYELSENQEYIELLQECASNLSKSAAKLKLYKEAYNYHVIFKTLTDSVRSQSNIKKITELESQFKYEKEKHATALAQEKKDAVLAAEMKQQKLIRNLFIGGFVMFLILTLIILRNLIQKRKANKLLAEQKEEIQTQAEELKSTNEKLVELDEFKENMNGMIIHDLKSPLNSILGLTKDNKIKEAAGRMLNLIVNVLDNQKFEEAQMRLDLQPVSVHETINEAVEQLSFLAKQKEIILNNKTQNYYLEADKDIVVRVVINLLSNAIKFSPSGNQIILATNLNKNFLEISITNFGKPIPKDLQPYIFDKFAQGEKKKSGYNYSSGIGLTFCKLAVEAHSGKIGVESNEKQTRFWFTLPLKHTQIQKDNISIQQNETNLILEENDIETAKVLGNQLKNIEIYEASKFEKVITGIAPVSDNFNKWLEQLAEKYYQMDEKLFQKQINDLETALKKLN